MRVAVVVLGDLGRSPRTLYHALALADEGVDVDLVGYADSALPETARDHSRISVHPIGGTRGRPSGGRIAFLARAAWRGFATFFRLLAVLLWRTKSPQAILVQNPPGVPVLLVAWMAARLRSARLVIDWHNLTQSMLALRLGAEHPLVKIVRWHERAIGQRADLNLFVSRAMRDDLSARWGLRGVVFRDRPAGVFTTLSAEAHSAVRTRLRTRLAIPVDETRFIIAVSPTSWTADEDFDLLLAAVEECESRWRDQRGELPHLVLLLTGRGPLKAHYEAKMAQRESARIHVRTVWLEAGEYPEVLAAADLGVCLHRSTSGLDLPMKIADMSGVGIPVCALNYGPCLSEIVQDGINGLLFSSPGQLADQLCALADEGPGEGTTLSRLRRGVRAATTENWQAAWRKEVWPALSSAIQR